MNGFTSIPFLFPGIPGVRCLFSTARTGTMVPGGGPASKNEAAANRNRFREEAGFDGWAEVRQIHGDVLLAAKAIDIPETEGIENADGQYTFERGLGLIVKTADCQPLLIAREDGLAVAALHVGWRGNAMNFPGSAVSRLCELFSCEPRALAAIRGPSLGPAASEFVNFREEWPEEFTPWYEPEAKTVNLWALTKRQLENAGMRSDRIYSLDLCTRDMPGWFFSHRRKDTGRHVNAIWMAR